MSTKSYSMCFHFLSDIDQISPGVEEFILLDIARRGFDNEIVAFDERLDGDRVYEVNIEIQDITDDLEAADG